MGLIRAKTNCFIKRGQVIRKKELKRLFEPHHIGGLKVKNRIIKTASQWGEIMGAKSIRLHEAIAKGGVGLIMIAVDVSTPTSIDPTQDTRLDRNRTPGFGKLTRVIHDNGARVFLEMTHRGAWQVGPPGTPGPLPISASSLTESELPDPSYDRFAANARELTISDIREIVNEFACFSEDAWKAGFDGVEINASRCHLLNSFLSRFWNRRKDEYGCESIKNRSRIVTDIIQEVKKRLGQDFPVCVQMNAIEYMVQDGITVEESKGIARELEKAGADALEVRAYGYGKIYNRLHIPEQICYPDIPSPLPGELDYRHKGAGMTIPLAGMIKSAVSIPIIVVGKVSPSLGDEALRTGKADFIGMCRGLFADPDLPRKLSSGKPEDIAPCTSCMECFRFFDPNKIMQCRINADVGCEEEYGAGRAEVRRRVVVIGGGPAGMEAARVAALRGHNVTLLEKEHKLGGSLYLAALIKGTEIEDLIGIIQYLKTQVTKLGVVIKTGVQADIREITKLNPDVVILATGSLPVVPEIEGIHNNNVVQPAYLHRISRLGMKMFGHGLLGRLSRLYMPIGKKVVVIGGSMHGCELAEFFAKRRRNVTIVDTAEEIGADLIDLNRARLFAWFHRKGVAMIPGVKYESITDKGLNILTQEGKKQTVLADTIVPAIPPVSNNELFNKLKGLAPHIYLAGDCREPRLIIDAISDGASIARSIG